MSYDSPRMEAAMKALREDLGNKFHDAPRRAATIALNAADAVMFDDAAVERAARTIHLLTTGSWASASEDVKATSRRHARAVFVAIRGLSSETRYACWTCDDCQDPAHEGRAVTAAIKGDT